MTTTTIAPSAFRFIKLGEQGYWEKSCIEDGTLRLGYESPHHTESLAGDWGTVQDFWLTVRIGDHKEATVKRDINQVKDFYELDSNSLWFTFYNRKLWWCFAQPEVTELEDMSRIRKTLNGWSCTDLKGRELTVQNLDGRVTTVQGFRGTICSLRPELHEYLTSKINGATTKDVDDALAHLISLTESMKLLVQGLWWKDFELLTDLIFSQAGWQRTSELGKTQKSIDLDMLSPVTGRRAYVQVKSSANIAMLNASIDEFKAMEAFDELFFVAHTTDRGIQEFTTEDQRIHVMDLDRIANLVINSGLVRWLINKRS
ncbi:restriction endonuclease [Janthinobacterium sp. SUN033]|uniref:restriction endonuclease n=1 Tax=Janthinobacterium sp. SUN033 TaxID=3002439 RepID=UPI0025B1C540|nr:restriction endonuclease [Janthinobacterium sp. SUN033]MDN2677678.1 hypothetical protein [Janthinobacterium sp. SUN033]